MSTIFTTFKTEKLHESKSSLVCQYNHTIYDGMGNNWTRKDYRVEFFYNHWYKEVKKEAYVRNTGRETIKPREGVEFRASNHRLLIVLKPIRNCFLPIVCQLIWILIYSYQFNSLHNCVAWRRIKLNFVLFKSLYSITLQIIDLFLWTGFVMILIKYMYLTL